ncbi:MAG: carboxypeptidase regulatory-like domain-containing protein, partial [Gemmatimonadetes bacterium]|nr:carboxypeptidase regulatory-like domain-containing protein [Gemmatimonadota bacterium]
MPPARVRTLALALALLVLTALPALAQQDGGVSGTVRDPATGRPVAGAHVDAVAPDGRVVGSTTTDAQGNFRLANLRPGHYSVVIKNEGGSESKLDAVIAAGQTATVNVQISAGAVALNPLVVSASKRPEKALE